VHSTNTKPAASCAIVCLALLVLAGAAQGYPGWGTNPILEQTGGEFNIPVTHASSGRLGEATNSGGLAGMKPDHVTLRAPNPQSAGNVSLELEFDLQDAPGLAEGVLAGSTVLLLTLRDLDFKVCATRTYELAETLTISFLPSVGQAAVGSQLTVGRANYDLPEFSAGPPGFETNLRTITYEIDPARELGLGQADLTNALQDGNFALLLEFNSYLRYTGGPHGSARYVGTPEQVSALVTTVWAPEPGIAATFAAGAGVLVGCKRASRHRPNCLHSQASLS